MKKILPLTYLVGAITIFLPQPTKAVAGLWDGLIPCRDSGTCQLNDFMILAVNVSKIILGLCGSLALGAFVYGGFMFLISAGSREKVEKAKTIIKSAIIGLIIIFVSYTLVGFIFRALGIEGARWFTGQVL
jgi:hypothetical protein